MREGGREGEERWLPVPFLRGCLWSFLPACACISSAAADPKNKSGKIPSEFKKDSGYFLFSLLLSGDLQFCTFLAQKSRVAQMKQLEKAALQLSGFCSLFSVWP